MERNEFTAQKDNLGIKDPQVIISAITILTGIVVWLYSTFATISYVKELHVQSINHSDANFEKNRLILLEIKESLKTIEQRIWALKEQEHQSKRQGRLLDGDS